MSGDRKLAVEEMVHLADNRSRVTVICTVRGGVEDKPLAQAFDATVARIPSLRCGIEQDGPVEFAFRPLTSGLPELQVRPGGPRALTEELNTPLPPGGPLVRATLLRGGDGAGEDEDTFVLSVDHAITDGQSALAVCHAVWRAYTAAAAGTFTLPEPAQDALPAPLSARLAPHSPEELAAYVAGRRERMRLAPMASLPFAAADQSLPEGELPLDAARVRLDAEQTARLVGHARAVGVSVHGLVVGSLLLAIREQLATGTETLRLSSMSPVDLRGRLDPPVDPEVMIPAASLFFDILDVPDGADPVSLGREVIGNLRAAIDRGDLAREILAAPQVLMDPSLLRAGLVTTNLGQVPVPEVPDGLEITDLRCFALGDKSFPQAGEGPLVVSVLTVLGRLDIEFPYSRLHFTAGQMAAIREAVRGHLLGLIA
ncbi:hypothetical protein [Streptomyces sp. NPDC021212]|uniref:phthiocerol/phthiodiolone dimycocerosyl transferase family protein n=1 Tax=Streptomyces sp. NPDC021212 TaxID=3365118 RepID=UPI0037AC44CE